MVKKLLVFLSLFFLTACGGRSSTPTQVAASVEIKVSSPAFEAMAAIPKVYSCEGDDLSPALAWNGIPDGTKSIALIMDDPDAPVGTWVHWVVYNLPAGTTGLPEGASKAKSETSSLPEGALHGQNSWKRADYGGPCPPSGKHRYFFHLYALDAVLDMPQGPSRKDLDKAMEGHIIGQGELVGTYQK